LGWKEILNQDSNAGKSVKKGSIGAQNLWEMVFWIKIEEILT